MSNILSVAFSLAGLVALVYVCVRYREPTLKKLSKMPLWSSAEQAPPPDRPRPSADTGGTSTLERKAAPKPQPKATVRPDPARDASERERFSARRIEVAAKVLVAEVEEYLARKADSK